MQATGAAGSGDPADAQRIDGLEERIAAEVRELNRRARGRRSQGPSGIRYLFIGGCPRSGTTAITTLLNDDERILLGQERFRRIRKIVEPFHFSEEVFFNPSARETSWAMPWRDEPVRPGAFADYHVLRERWHSGSVEILGDKAPYYAVELDRLASVFGEAKFVIMVRDLDEVAASYRRRATDPADTWPAENDHRVAIRDWNRVLQHARAFVDDNDRRLLLVSYSRFFRGARDELDRLYAFLGLDLPAAMRERHDAMVLDGERRRARAQPLPPTVAAAIDAARNPELETWAAQAVLD